MGLVDNSRLTLENTMKTITYRILVAIIVASALAGCQTVKQESAMDWLARQPFLTDDP